MTQPSIQPYGTWTSPLRPADLARASRRFGHLASDGEALYWLESRPEEAGRNALMCYRPGGAPEEVLPAEFSVRSRVHEYGGGDFWLGSGTLVFARAEDQRLYLVRAGEAPVAITPEPPSPRAWRYADGAFTADGRALVCVRERHEADGQVHNELVAVELASGRCRVLVQGADFYAAPRLGPNGRLIWLSWSHPDMPWDATVLFQGYLDEALRLHEVRRLAGGPGESVIYPQFAPDGRLYYVSDRGGYYSLYALDPDGIAEDLTPMPVDFAPPFWGLGYASYAFDERGRALALGYECGDGEAWLLEPDTDHLERLELPYRAYGGTVVALGGHYAFLACTDEAGEALVLMDGDSRACRVLRQSSELRVPVVSKAQATAFADAGGELVHAFYYPPRSAAFQGPENERPPLILMSHSGPTGATTAGFNAAIQFWTSRGFAVADVNYRGSTGYGRAYRDALRGQWGVLDVADCILVARELARRGLADEHRLLIRGGSAGGFTTLCALVFHKVFAAGMSRYGVADLESLVKDSHKFEARYLDGLVAPYPQRADIYRERSPLHHAERISCPLLLLQGADDPVVPPSQAMRFAQALDAKGLPHALVLFEGEGHGFRKAETLEQALALELGFYRRVLGLVSEEASAPMNIVHLA
ncbi:MAG: S9 family peptidase [Gammaproteobacteria bacterium]|nr:S9 family peptidase [Gammaproteobacteria bacterium]